MTSLGALSFSVLCAKNICRMLLISLCGMNINLIKYFKVYDSIRWMSSFFDGAKVIAKVGLSFIHQFDKKSASFRRRFSYNFNARCRINASKIEKTVSDWFNYYFMSIFKTCIKRASMQIGLTLINFVLNVGVFIHFSTTWLKFSRDK